MKNCETNIGPVENRTHYYRFLILKYATKVMIKGTNKKDSHSGFYFCGIIASYLFSLEVDRDRPSASIWCTIL